VNRLQLARRRSIRAAGRERVLRGSDPSRSTAGRLLGAAEICLLARDPHLAARALWLLLKDQEPVRHRCTPRSN